jgi:hypothetical protein
VNVDFPFTSVEDCIKKGVAKEINLGLDSRGEKIGTKCADLDCANGTPIAWVWQSQVFKFEAGRLLALPVTLWFPLCPKHAPLQEEAVEEVPVATE